MMDHSTCIDCVRVRDNTRSIFYFMQFDQIERLSENLWEFICCHVLLVTKIGWALTVNVTLFMSVLSHEPNQCGLSNRINYIRPSFWGNVISISWIRDILFMNNLLVRLRCPGAGLISSQILMIFDGLCVEWFIPFFGFNICLRIQNITQASSAILIWRGVNTLCMKRNSKSAIFWTVW